jgi:hypothetical protein
MGCHLYSNVFIELALETLSSEKGRLILVVWFDVLQINQ